MAGGVGVLLLVALLVVASFWVGGLMSGLDAAVESRQRLDERFGSLEEFIPWPGPAIPSDRLEAFLAVREASMPARRRLDQLFRGLPFAPKEMARLEREGMGAQLRAALRMSRVALGLGSATAEFFESRNRALLDTGMGMGEYTFLYVLAYYTWLERSPMQEPLPGPGQEPAAGDPVAAEPAEPGEGGGGLRAPVRRRMVALLRNQLAAARSGAAAEWSGQLSAEIAALEADASRIPWQDGVPAPLAASLAPYRQRLEAAYRPLTDGLEVARNRRSGRWSFTVD